NTLTGSDPNGANDVTLNNNLGTTHVNLSKNGSSSMTANGVILDDNIVGTEADAGTITLVTTLPSLPPSIMLGSTNPGAATVGVSYNQALSASGGTGPYTFALVGGALPAGLALSAAGALSGIPTADGSFSFTVEATDTISPKASDFHTYTLTVSAP